MTKKKLNSNTILLFVFCVFFATSCGEDWLSVDPIGKDTEANFYQNEEQIYQGLIAAYDVLSWGGTNGWTMSLGLLTAASDEAFAGGSDRSDQPAWVAWDEFNLDSELGPQEGFWDKHYTGIGRSNLILEKIASAPEGLDQELLARFAAEARFLRAYNYFYLVKYFGTAVLTTERISPDQILSQSLVGTDVIYDQIEADLLAAYNEPTLPLQTAGEEQGRVSKMVVTAMLGKILLHRNDESRFGDAAEYFQEVIDSGLYDLEENFGDIYRFDNEWGVESVWEIQHSEKSRGGWEVFDNGTEGNYTTQFIGMRDYVGPTSTQYMGENFATGWSFCPVTPQLAEHMQNDPRYTHTIIDGQMLKNLGASYTEGYQNTDFFIRKYVGIVEESAPDGEPALNWSNNERVIRYADILLMAAETLVRGGGDSGQARGYLNAVRSRVGLTPLSNSGDALLQAIYRERRLELATEGHRFFDLVRTGTAADFLPGFEVGKHEVLPIPQREIDLSQGGLKQNPGY